MNSDFLRIPEPSGPEAELLRSAASLPQLSPELRLNVLAECSRQLVIGRTIRATRTAAVVLSSVGGIAALVWILLPGSAPPPSTDAPPATAPVPVQTTTSSPGNSLSLPLEPPSTSLGNSTAAPSESRKPGNQPPETPPTTPRELPKPAQQSVQPPALVPSIR
ncbi:MAG: hypothetical protein RLZZ436_3088 [Planctomycetota bacterium]|jgi:hypothetical protein